MEHASTDIQSSQTRTPTQVLAHVQAQQTPFEVRMEPETLERQDDAPSCNLYFHPMQRIRNEVKICVAASQDPITPHQTCFQESNRCTR